MQGKLSLQEAQLELARKQKKTNAAWYRFDMFGSYFKFDQGYLFQCPMNENGTRAESMCEVDWERIDEVEKQSLLAVAQVLAAYP